MGPQQLPLPPPFSIPPSVALLCIGEEFGGWGRQPSRLLGLNCPTSPPPPPLPHWRWDMSVVAVGGVWVTASKVLNINHGHDI
jgi:hypothetical protein